MACSSPREESVPKPENFFTEKEMVEILTDFRLTESIVRQMASYGEDTKILSDYYYKKVLEKHQITSDDFKDNLKYYSAQPEKMYKIYSKVVNKLTEIHSEVSTRK
jgi:hypothetical protein